MSGAVTGTPWTAADKARLVQIYADGGIEAAARAFPDRSRTAIYHVARRAGIVRKRRWTRRDDDRLRILWGSVSLPEICRTLGRTRSAIMFHAVHVLWLPSGCPDNLEYLSKSAERTGYGTVSLRRILRWAGVAILPAYTFRGDGHQRWLVEPHDVDDAIERWHLTETLEGAARRLGTSAETMQTWLARAGIVVKKTDRRRAKSHARVLSADADRAWALRAEFYAKHPGRALPRWPREERAA